MKKKTITTCIKHLAVLLLACCFTSLAHAEKRYYFTRSGNLPADAGLTTVDLRSGQNGVTITPNQMTLDLSYNYTYYTKPNTSWFSFNQQTSSSIDMSDVNTDFDNWYLKLKIKTNIATTNATYPEINVILNGTGATTSAFQLSETDLLRNGGWQIITLKLSEYKSAASLQTTYTSARTGMLFQMHGSDPMSAGFLAIDYAYLTNDPTGTDAGDPTAVNPTRYYLLTNKQTPASGNFDMVDFSGDVDANSSATGWSMPAYATYPFYTLDGADASADFAATTDNVELTGGDDTWYLQTMIKTNTTGAVKFTLIDCAGDEYVYTVPVADYTNWTPVTVLLSDFTGTGTLQYDCARATGDVLFRYEIEGGASDDIFYMGYLFITDEDVTASADPEPAELIDPSKERRIYFVNDGSALPADIISTDYRIGVSSNVKLNIAQQDGWQSTLNRDLSYGYLYFTTITSWWYSVDIQADGAGVDLSDVTSAWYLNLKMKSESASRPINPYLYPSGQTTGTGLITETMLPVGGWAEIEIPLSDYGSNLSFGTYTSGSNIFSLNAGHTNTADQVVAIEYLYLSNVKKDDGQTTLQTQLVTNDIQIHCDGNILFVTGLNESSDVRIIDLNGKVLSQFQVSGNSYQTALNLPKGIYLVEVISSGLPKKIAKIIL